MNFNNYGYIRNMTEISKNLGTLIIYEPKYTVAYPSKISRNLESVLHT